MIKGALVVSAIGLVTWVFPPIGFAVSWIGLILGIMAQKDTKSKAVKAATIMSIAGLCLCLANALAGFVIK